MVSVATSAPALDTIKPQDQGAASVIYSADGQRLGFISNDVLRTPVTGGQIPQVARDATVAIEDRRFFEHKGVDFEGVVRAAVKNLESKDDVQGGSTLTMQLIRNLYTKDTVRTGIEGYKRKIREAKLAEELENRHPGRRGKRWILDQYLNNVPYGTVGGKTAVGIQAAARIFYDKPADKLTLAEAALLAGLPQAPSLYNPFLSAGKAEARRNDVLRRMADQGFITQSQAAEAIDEPLGVKANGYYSKKRESYFYDYVKQQLVDEYGAKRVQAGGMHIYTTLNLKMQKAARKALDDNLAGTDRSGSIVTVDPANGDIKAMASNATYGQFKFNLASQGHYAAGLDVQGDGVDDRPAQGRRPQQHHLHVDAAEVQRPHVGADRRPHLLRQLHRPRQPRQGDARLRQLDLPAARPRPRARRRSRRPRSTWGSRAPSTRCPPPRSAA